MPTETRNPYAGPLSAADLWGRPAGCATGCTANCNQGRLPCPNRPADVAAMREMGVDLRPLPQQVLDQHREDWRRLYEGEPMTPRSLGLALLIAGLAIVASFFAPWGFALPL